MVGGVSLMAIEKYIYLNFSQRRNAGEGDKKGEKNPNHLCFKLWCKQNLFHYFRFFFPTYSLKL